MLAWKRSGELEKRRFLMFELIYYCLGFLTYFMIVLMFILGIYFNYEELSSEFFIVVTRRSLCFLPFNPFFTNIFFALFLLNRLENRRRYERLERLQQGFHSQLSDTLSCHKIRINWKKEGF